MAQEQDAGYYIQGWGFGGTHGPLAEPSVRAEIVYGTPTTDAFSLRVVDPIEQAYELLLYTDPAKQDMVYVTRYDPEHIVWGADKFAQPVSATPELIEVFNSKLEEWETNRETNIDRINEAFTEGMAKAGLTVEDIPQPPSENDPKQEHQTYIDHYSAFMRQVRDNAPAVELLNVKIEGIDEVLEQLPITPQPERYYASQ